MRNHHLSLLTTLAFLGACQQAAHDIADEGMVPLLLDGRHHDHFGLGAHEGDILELDELLAMPESFDGKVVRVTGSIQSICKKAGCWARMGTGDPDLVIKMKDHAFLLPTDCEGREAVAEGRLAVQVTSVVELQHYMEDAGKPEEAAKITKPRREVVLIATGVALTKPGSN